MDHLTKVFIPHDDHVWVTGELIVESGDGLVEVRIDDSEVPRNQPTLTLNLKKLLGESVISLPLQNVDIPNDGVDDMCSLSYLHEPSILDNLRRRFFGKKPYTFTGDICVAVNPYQWLELYSDKMRQEYSHKYPHELPPHVYATSAAAYRGITAQNLNQCILVSGESGAGKTETVKILMGHLASIASKSGDETVDRLLKANPLLESFGNAKTVRNDNSSRFGRFSQLEFDGQNVLVGSKCITYLLEKSRVVGQSPGERNYHIMYELLAASKEIREKILLQNFSHPQNLNYLSSGDTTTSIIEGVKDGDRFVHTLDALELLGVQGETKMMLLRALASVLHLGQLAFQRQNSNSDAVELLPRGSDKAVDEAADACCSLLGITLQSFSSTITSRTIDVEGKKLSVPLNYNQVLSGRDALAKELYARVFGWLVLVINFNTSYATNGGNPSSSCSTVSLLDIFGFECFQVNRFEQLCINYANEKLQQKFATDVFKTVQREYAEEGIRLESIIFKDNTDVLEMIEGRGGLISNLTEECMIPRGNDTNYLAKISKAHSSHPAFFIQRTAKDQFSVRHYAGDVSYVVTGFVDTNKDTLPNNMAELFQGSVNPLLQRLFTYPSLFQLSDPAPFLAGDKAQNKAFLMIRMSEKNGLDGTTASREIDSCTPSLKEMKPTSDFSSPMRRGSGPAKSTASSSFVLAETVAVKFQNQLATLMDTISATQVQYVRCIKPNPNKSNKEFYRPLVVEQLRSGGMIAAVKISRQAYPNRLPYVEFLERYKHFQSKAWHDNKRRDIQLHDSGIDLFKESIELCKSLLLSVFSEMKTDMDPQPKDDMELYQFGFTKIYYSSFLMKHLELLRARRVASFAIRIQSIVKMYLGKKRFQAQKRSILMVQKCMRGYVAKKRYRIKLAAHKAELKRLAREAAEIARLAQEAEAARLKDKAEMEKERLRLEEEARAERARNQAREKAEIARRLQEHREQVERIERERIAAEAEAEKERVRLEAEQDRLRIEAEKREAAKQAEILRALAEAAERDRVKLLEIAAAEASRLKALEATAAEAELARQAAAAEVEIVRAETERRTNELQAEAEAEKTRLQKELKLRETRESRLKVQLESEKVQRESFEYKLRDVIDTFNQARLRTQTAVSSCVSSVDPTKELDPNSTEHALYKVMEVLSGQSTARSFRNISKAGDSSNLNTARTSNVDFMSPRTDAGDYEDSATDEIDNVKREIAALHDANFMAMEMISNHIIKLSSQASEEQEIRINESKSQTESYEQQLNFQLDYLVDQRSLPNLQVHSYQVIENPFGYVEYEILYEVQLELSKETLPEIFTFLNHVDHRRSVKLFDVQVQLFRRYSEFEKLAGNLKTQRVHLPALPEKQWLPSLGDRWKSEDFLNERRALLDVWLGQVLQLVTMMTPESILYLKSFLNPYNNETNRTVSNS